MKRLLLALMTITSVGLQSANADGGVAVRIGGVGFQIWDRDRDHRGHGHDHRPVFRPRPVVVQPVPCRFQYRFLCLLHRQCLVQDTDTNRDAMCNLSIDQYNPNIATKRTTTVR